jgi:hypothetical protein
MKLLILALYLMSTNSLQRQEKCREIQPLFWYDTCNMIYPAEYYRDSILLKSREIELNIDGSVYGNYKILFNDSTLFSGKIRGDISTGYFEKVFYLSAEKDNSIVTMTNLEDSVSVSFILLTRHLYVELGMWESKCKLVVTYSNRHPKKM